jgi:hypothetical protein
MVEDKSEKGGRKNEMDKVDRVGDWRRLSALIISNIGKGC